MNTGTIEMPKVYYRKSHPDGWIRVSEAAKELNVTESAIKKMIADKRLVAEQPGGPNSLWFICPESIDKLKESNK